MTRTQSRAQRGSEAVTHGVRVAVTPQYLADQSDPAARRWIFGYRIRVTNTADRPVRLVSRHWIIVDAAGVRNEVRGDGVIGQQPLILPGHTFEYASFCDIPTRWGTMEGTYLMKRDGSEPFEVAIARFYLVASDDA